MRKVSSMLAVFFAIGFFFSAIAEAQQENTNARKMQKNTNRGLIKGYTKPLMLDPAQNGVEFSPLEFAYELSEGRLSLGAVSFTSQGIGLSLDTLNNLDQRLAQEIKSPNELTMLVMWPQELMPSGTIEAIGRSGEVIWYHEIDGSDVKAWQAQLDEYANKYSWAKELRANKGGPLWASQYAIRNIDRDSESLFNYKGVFRFCLTRKVDKELSRICSGRMEVKRSSTAVRIARFKSPQEPRVLVSNEAAPMSGVGVAQAGRPFQFYAELDGGASYELVTSPQTYDIYDFVGNRGGAEVVIEGRGVAPVAGKVRILNAPNQSSWASKLGWLPTMGDTDVRWKALVPAEDAVLYFPGKVGGVFRMKLNFKQLPKPQHRIYVEDQTISGTYSDAANIYGLRPGKVQLSSDTRSVEMLQGGQEFKWTLLSDKVGETQPSYLKANMGGTDWYFRHDMYRAYNKEISARLTGVVTSAVDVIFLGELAYNHWFESLFGLRSYYLSKQRWGFSGKFFQSLVSIEQEAGQAPLNLASTNLDLKYRFTPGLWGQDETWGAILSYQDLKLSQLGSGMIGAGFFWARSMPKVFDDIFNYIPIFRYPKWVDLDFVTYASSLDSNIILGANYALNFHGKIYWTQRVFGEAGFGMKGYELTSAQSGEKAVFQTLYGTVGLGMNF